MCAGPKLPCGLRTRNERFKITHRLRSTHCHGKVLGKTGVRHTIAEFITFLEHLLSPVRRWLDADKLGC
jgi:hypothetical protein